MQRREGVHLQAPVLPSHFWLLLLPFYFYLFVSSIFSWHFLLLKQKKRKKNTKKKKSQRKKKCKEGKELTFKLPFYPSFLALALAFLFQALSLGIFFFSNKRKKKKNTKKNKSIKKKKIAEKGGSLPSSSISTLSFLAHASTLLLLPFRFKCFLLTSSSSQTEEKKHTQRKKNHKEKKIARRERVYLFSLPSAFGMKHSSCFLLSTFLEC